jgi:hypothetical protein
LTLRWCTRTDLKTSASASCATGSPFAKAADRVQWDIFRAEVLESQKWRLLRLWSPQLFRNPAAAIARIKKTVDEWLAEEAVKTAAAAVVKERPIDARLLN